MSKKRIFISFAIEDANLRDLLVGQVKNENSPFEFVDMSVKLHGTMHGKPTAAARSRAVTAC